VKVRKIIVTGTVVCGLALPLTKGFGAEAKAGKAIYDKLCASCHGADGKGNPAMMKAMGEKGLNLTTKEVAKMKDDEFLKITVEGRGKMPASGKNLTKQEQKQVLEYTRSLAK
jgi:mono/diheme cytochrome c family protein